MARILIVEARFYPHLNDMLLAGARAAIEAAGHEHETITVPGALEIPGAIAFTLEGDEEYDGFVALGCVIRGETAHYDIVCENANRWLVDVAVRQDVPVGNGILTVDTEAQASARAEGGRSGKGGDAVRACLKLIELKRNFWGPTA